MKTDHLKLSVIIPVFNSGKYLEKCITSILGQTFTEFELILVDDGSTDGSSEICDRYAVLDKRISVIHQNNSGSVSARKAGVLKATGEYISFADSDDWIEPEMYEDLFKSGYNSDIIACGFTFSGKGEERYYTNMIDSGIYEGDRLQTVLKSVLFTGRYYESGINPALWNKLFKRELIIPLYNMCPLKIRMGDDAMITYPALFLSGKLAVLNDIRAYHYRRYNESTLSTSFDPDYFESQKALYFWLKKEISKASLPDRQLSYYMLFLAEIGFNRVTYGIPEWNHVKKIMRRSNLRKENWIKEAISETNDELLPKETRRIKDFFLERNTAKAIQKYYFGKNSNS